MVGNMSLTFFGKFARFALLAVWALVIIFAVAFYFLYPSAFTAGNIAAFITSFETEIWLIYLAMSAIRGFTLLPSTPLVVAGTFLYPDEPWLVLAISMTGILISSSLIYFCSEAIGFHEYFEHKKPRAVARIRNRLEQPWGLAFVALWAFFPLVPTDAVCYAAGTTKMNFLKFVLAVFIGELVLCSIYVFTGGTIFRALR
jgi:uncharacterized membrane protein YdjX (TVP38/TMEM64 family)